jgi:hypothetical protein
MFENEKYSSTQEELESELFQKKEEEKEAME